MTCLSDTCSQGSVATSSDSNGPDSAAPLGSPRLTPSHQMSLTVTGLASRTLATSVRSATPLTSISSAEASPASPSPSRDEGSRSKTSAGSGRSSSGSSRLSVRAGSSLKTSLVSAVGDLQTCSEDLPISGMTRSGFVYRLPQWERRTYANASTSWPTPRATDGHGPGVRWKSRASSRDNLTERMARLGMGGRLNPRWVEWLMGFPIGWLNFERSETP